MTVIYKTHLNEKVDGLEFVMSDETPDRAGDIILSGGWQLDNFRKNPKALFGHRSDFIIGKWTNVRVENRQLRGRLELAKKGTSERVNEVISLVEQGLLSAASVGFAPLESKPRADKDGGYLFSKQDLVETSLVSVPANPNALAIAKGLKISPATLDLVFAGQGNESRLQTRGLTGGQADRKTNGKGTTMSLAQRITDTEKQLTEKRDKLAAFHDGKGDGNYSDEDMETVTRTNADISRDEKLLDMLRASERNMGANSDDGGRHAAAASKPAVNGSTPRPFAMAPKKMSPIDMLCRSAALRALAHAERRPIEDVCRNEDEVTKAVVEYQAKAASAVATTTLTGWAAELVQTINAEFMQTLMPTSVFPRLSNLGLTLSFGRNGKISIPTRSRTPTIAGSFVGEGLPIPVRQGAFTAQTLTPKKMAVITTWTREIDEHSVPAIQALLRDAIQQDTAISLDAVLLDANAATAVRPAGLLNGVAGLTPTAGGGFAALVGDIKQLTGALLTGTAGNVRTPAWLMNPIQANAIGLVAAPGAGVFPFSAEINAGRLGGWPVIVAGTVPATTVIVVDAADFVSVSDGPRFEISDQATLHMEDTAPTDISTSGTAVAFPAKSMFQTDSMALRLILPMNWLLRRSGVVAWCTGVTW